LESVHAADRERAKKVIQASLEAGETYEFQCRIVLPDASIRWIHSKGRVLRASDGAARGMLGGVLDITYGKRSEEQQQRSAKLEAIGQLAGGIAHDFNNLLVAILGNLDLAETSSDIHEARQRIADAMQAANQAAELTQQLLVFSRQQPLHQASLDCHDLLSDTMRLLKRLLPETIELELIRAHRLPRVLGDRGQLEQVIVNLCVNARDAMPTGGRLTIETEVVLINGRFRESHPWARPGRYVLIAVTDTGVGIPQDKIDHIFEPFFTTKEAGTGLGLATAYSIVKRHGGLVHVYSELNKGTTFKVYLPIAERNAGDVGTKVDVAVAGGTETILLAEDEDAVRAVVMRMLERAGYQVIGVSDGQQAVDIYKARGAEISLILLDAVMPNKGGPEALSEIRELDPNVPALLCSGYSEAPGLWTERSDTVEFLAKPYEPDALLRMLRRLLDHSADNGPDSAQ
jgi:signal transduction histidine kinase/ActR/RegA family two-component response regulator